MISNFVSTYDESFTLPLHPLYNKSKVLSIYAPKDERIPEISVKTKLIPSVRNSSDIFPFQTHTDCRLHVEKQHFVLIDKWLEEELPILDYVIEIDGQLTVFFILKHFSYRPYDLSKFRNVMWYCASTNGTNTLAASVYQSKSASIKVNCQVGTNRIWTKTLVSISGKNDVSESFDIESFVQCDKLEQIESKNEIPKDTKIGACLEIRGNRHLVAPWIEYHRIIGIQHFWIFVNEAWSLEGFPKKPYITYIPFNYYHEDHRNHSHWRNDGSFFWQVPMQMQCIYRMKRLNLDWVVTTDVDEYIYVNLTQKEQSNQTKAVPVLQKFLATVDDYENIGALQMSSIFFGRNILVEPENTTYPLLIDFVWRKKKNYLTRQKLIYNPRNAKSVGVHFLWNGGYIKKATSELYMHHYKNSHSGVFDPKTLKPCTSEIPILKDSNLVDKYRDKIIKAL